MEIFQTNEALEFEEYANECLSGHEGCVIHVSDIPCVWTGQLQTYDENAVSNLGFEVGVGQYIGGTIVCFPGDVSICITTWGESELAKNIVDLSATWFNEKGLSVTCDENDVMIDDKKVVSWARATTLDGWCQSVVHFSVGAMDLGIVREICKKPMGKIPGSLGEYGITAGDILNRIIGLIT